MPRFFQHETDETSGGPLSRPVSVRGVGYTAAMMRPLSTTLRVVVLGSGSAGNAIAVSDGAATLLVDCGFSAREVTRRLTSSGVDPHTVRAVLVTHEHTDHTRGVEVFARQRGAAVCASHGTRRAAGLDGLATDVRTLEPGRSHEVGGFTVIPFRTSHDAAEPVGYRIESADGHVVGIATDTGVLTAEAEEALQGCDVLGLESNHDVRMLETGPYPYFLKRRIASERGHLSNEAAAEAVERLLSPRLRRVVALHRSRTNNTRDLVVASLERRLAQLGFEGDLVAADQGASCGDLPRAQETLFG